MKPRNKKYSKWTYSRYEFSEIVDIKRKEEIIKEHIDWLIGCNEMPSQIYRENYNGLKHTPIYKFYLNSNLRGCNRRKSRKWPTAEV